jgi:hypothetical protein
LVALAGWHVKDCAAGARVQVRPFTTMLSLVQVPNGLIVTVTMCSATPVPRRTAVSVALLVTLPEAPWLVEPHSPVVVDVLVAW